MRAGLFNHLLRKMYAVLKDIFNHFLRKRVLGQNLILGDFQPLISDTRFVSQAVYEAVVCLICAFLCFHAFLSFCFPIFPKYQMSPCRASQGWLQPAYFALQKCQNKITSLRGYGIRASHIQKKKQRIFHPPLLSHICKTLFSFSRIRTA